MSQLCSVMGRWGSAVARGWGFSGAAPSKRVMFVLCAASGRLAPIIRTRVTPVGHELIGPSVVAFIYLETR